MTSKRHAFDEDTWAVFEDDAQANLREIEASLLVLEDDPSDGAGGVTFDLTKELGATVLNMSFLRRNDDPELTIVAKISNDLNSWTASPAALQTLSVVDQGNGYELVTVREVPPPIPSGATFGHVEVTRTAP